MTFREKLWTHRPLTDFWRIGKGISQKLEAMQLFTLGDVARASLDQFSEDRLYKTFGVNAELIIDHAWGWEPVTMEDIRQYRPSTSSISSGQVLQCPYDFEKGRLIVREMTKLLVLELVRKHMVTKQIVLDIRYDHESLEGDCGKKYANPVATDSYGRKIPKAAHDTGNLDGYTRSTHAIMNAKRKFRRRSPSSWICLRIMRRSNVKNRPDSLLRKRSADCKTLPSLFRTGMKKTPCSRA